MDGCEPETGERGERFGHSRIEVALGCRGQDCGNEIHRRFAQDSCRLFAGGAIDHTTRRVVGMAIDAGSLQRGARHPGRMAVFAPKEHRAAAGGFVEMLS